MLTHVCFHVLLELGQKAYKIFTSSSLLIWLRYSLLSLVVNCVYSYVWNSIHFHDCWLFNNSGFICEMLKYLHSMWKKKKTTTMESTSIKYNMYQYVVLCIYAVNRFISIFSLFIFPTSTKSLLWFNFIFSRKNSCFNRQYWNSFTTQSISIFVWRNCYYAKKNKKRQKIKMIQLLMMMLPIP